MASENRTPLPTHFSNSFSKPPANNDKVTNIVWCLAYTPDGTKLLAVVGDFILVYDTKTGEVIHSVRGYHKADIYCIAINRNGSRMATGSADKQVIIWKSDFKPEAKYTQGESIQCMEFDPLTGKLFSGGEGQFVVSTFDEKKIERNSYKGKILCCSWTPDG